MGKKAKICNDVQKARSSELGLRLATLIQNRNLLCSIDGQCVVLDLIWLPVDLCSDLVGARLESLKLSPSICRVVRDLLIDQGLLSLGIRYGNGSSSRIGLAAVRVHSLAVEVEADE